MKRSGSNRVPRKIAGDEEAEGGGTASSQVETQRAQAQPVVKRPVFAKAKKRSSLRISFGPGDAESNDGEESNDSAVVTPKKSNLSRIAIEKNAARRAGSPLVSELSRPRASLDEDRPSYNKDSLAELRNSTPTTPKDLELVTTDDDETSSQALDLSSKFGPAARLSSVQPSAIPTEAEIREKKARRARAAKEQGAYISLDDDHDQDDHDPDDDEFRTNRNEISLRPKDKYEETRLVREDEDMAEGFDEYVEDGSISLGRKAEREAQRKRRTEMAELIADAEKGSDEESDSEAERNAAYEDAQTRAGTYGRRDEQNEEEARQPPRLARIPDLKEVLAKLQDDLNLTVQRKQMILQQREEIRAEEVRIAEQKQYIQEQLDKAGEEYEKVRQETGMAALPPIGINGGTPTIERGLESLGTTPLPAREGASEDELGSSAV